MKTLREIFKEAEDMGRAVGHFNISDSVALRAIFESARELNVPILIGASEGERDFLGVRQTVALVKSLREEYDYPIFLNADHTHSVEKIKEAVEAGFDAVLFDGSKLPFEENVRLTKEVVQLAKSLNPDVVVEGELGYIGSSSAILKEIPEGAAMKPEDLTSPEQSAIFIKETGIDLFAPAVGNLHGMLVRQSTSGGGFETINPRLDINRISEIKKVVGIPLVLHGGSGIVDEDFVAAIKAGITIIHINTEIRLAWRKGIEEGLKNNPDEVAPYKIYPPALEGIKRVVRERLRLFSGS